MFPGAERGHREFEMRLRWCGDNHRIDVWVCDEVAAVRQQSDTGMRATRRGEAQRSWVGDCGQPARF